MAARRRLLGCGIALSACLAALGAAEIAVRLLRPQAVLLVDRGLYAPDPPRRYRLAPGFRGTIRNRVEFSTPVAINTSGTRGPELAPGAAPLLLGLGDSFAFGVGVEDGEAWPLVLARALGAEGANGGTPGFSVPDAVDWFEAHGLQLEPDFVVLGVFLGNDLQDATPGVPRVEARDGALVVFGGAETPYFLRWLHQHSHLFALAKQGALWARLRSALGRGEAWGQAELRREMRLFEVDPGRGLETAFGGGLAATDRALERFTALTRMHGVRALVALFPTLPQVSDPLWRDTAISLGLDADRLDRDAPNHALSGLCNRHGLVTVDLTAAFRDAAARGESLYYPIDRHLNARGQALAASVIARALATAP